MTDSVQLDVLVIADDPDQLRLISAQLSQEGLTVAGSANGRDGIALARRDSPKVVLCDDHLPDIDGVEVCRRLRRACEATGCHFILMSADASGTRAWDAINTGADDFLAKPIQRQELTARVRAGVRLGNMQAELRRAAMIDGLTGLCNHDHFNRILEQEMSRARRYGHPLACIMVDVDFFKAVNDTYGHLAGNAALEAIARTLDESIRDVDTLARFGGEEFVVVLPEARAGEAGLVAERMRRAIQETLQVEELRGHVVTASFGVADSEDARVKTSADLVDLADRALFVAKRRGRNRVAFAHELTDKTDPILTSGDAGDEGLRRRVAVLTTRSKDVHEQSVGALLQALDEKDPQTAQHVRHVARYARQIAERLGVSAAAVGSVFNAALLHDIGKIGVPDRILLKRCALTAVERMVMDQVPLIGTRIVEQMKILEAEIAIIRHQREHFDGSGFPAGLCGDAIPIGSRILLVADAFDAMTTDHPYRARMSLPDAISELEQHAGSQFDPRVVVALENLVSTDRQAWERRIEDANRLSRPPSEAQLAAAAAPV